VSSRSIKTIGFGNQYIEKPYNSTVVVFMSYVQKIPKYTQSARIRNWEAQLPLIRGDRM